jgi:serine/threonine protein kinase
MGETQDNQARGKWINHVLRYPLEVAKAKFGDEIGKGQFGKTNWLNDENGTRLPIIAKTALTAETEAELTNEAKFYEKAGDHPNIARCYGILPVDGKPALVMEGIKGRNMSGTMELLDKLRNGDAKTLAQYGRTKQISQSEYVGVLQHVTLQMLNGLAHLEKQGVVHKDIRPDNVMIDQATGQVKLIDFGVAQDAGVKPTGKSPIFSGSVSPDVESKQPMTAKHDMFALGEAARKTMEADQFRYLTGKDAAQLSKEDVKAFGEPQQDGVPKRALNRRPDPQARPQAAPNKFATRAKEIAEAADKALQDQYVGGSREARALTAQLKTADHIAKMEEADAAKLIADMEQNLAALVRLYPMFRGGSYDPLAAAKDAATNKLDALLRDPAIARSETGRRLACHQREVELIRSATRQDEPAQGLNKMESAVKDDVAEAAGRAGAQLVDTDPLAKQIADLLARPGVKGTPDEQMLRTKQRDLTLINRLAGAPNPEAAIAERLRLIRQEVDAAETDLARTGTYGAETDYTRFVNWMMHPDPTKRPSPGKLLQVLQALDAMDDEQRKAMLDKADPIKPAKGAPRGVPLRFLADRLGDGASMRQLLAGVLGAAATAEPVPRKPAPQQPGGQQPAPQQAMGRRPGTVLPVVPQQADDGGAARGADSEEGRLPFSYASAQGIDKENLTEVYSAPTEDDEQETETERGSVSRIDAKFDAVYSEVTQEDGEKAATRYASANGIDVEKLETAYSEPTENTDGNATKK